MSQYLDIFDGHTQPTQLNFTIHEEHEDDDVRDDDINDVDYLPGVPETPKRKKHMPSSPLNFKTVNVNKIPLITPVKKKKKLQLYKIDKESPARGEQFWGKRLEPFFAVRDDLMPNYTLPSPPSSPIISMTASEEEQRILDLQIGLKKENHITFQVKQPPFENQNSDLQERAVNDPEALIETVLALYSRPLGTLAVHSWFQDNYSAKFLMFLKLALENSLAYKSKKHFYKRGDNEVKHLTSYECLHCKKLLAQTVSVDFKYPGATRCMVKHLNLEHRCKVSNVINNYVAQKRVDLRGAKTDDDLEPKLTDYAKKLEEMKEKLKKNGKLELFPAALLITGKVGHAFNKETVTMMKRIISENVSYFISRSQRENEEELEEAIKQRVVSVFLSASGLFGEHNYEDVNSIMAVDFSKAQAIESILSKYGGHVPKRNKTEEKVTERVKQRLERKKTRLEQKQQMQANIN